MLICLNHTCKQLKCVRNEKIQFQPAIKTTTENQFFALRTRTSRREREGAQKEHKQQIELCLHLISCVMCARYNASTMSQMTSNRVVSNERKRKNLKPIINITNISPQNGLEINGGISKLKWILFFKRNQCMQYAMIAININEFKWYARIQKATTASTPLEWPHKEYNSVFNCYGNDK